MPPELRVERVERDRILALRAQALNADGTGKAAFSGDLRATTRHWAALVDDAVVGCASVMRLRGYALRGMAVAREFRRRGIGARMLRVVCAEVDAPMWCNARLDAVPFYLHRGWLEAGPTFDLRDKGPHRRLTWTPLRGAAEGLDGYTRAMDSPDLIVVGGPSLDRLVVGGVEHRAPGGAAFITALAARSAGAKAGLVARVPPAMPEEIARVFGPGGIDRAGITTADGTLASFLITYDEDFKASYEGVASGLEAGLGPDDIPGQWLEEARWLHVAAVAGSAEVQLRILRGARDRGFDGGISTGTYPRLVVNEPDAGRTLAREADLFFCNRDEADALFPDGSTGGPNSVLCITEGAAGVEVVGGEHAGRYPAPPAAVVDATGAGDSFCGGYLAGVLEGRDPVMSGMDQAAIVLGGYGARPLAARVAAGIAPRVRLDRSRIDAVAARLAGVARGAAFDFAGFPFPDAGDPRALETLALATLHQYGFWTADETRWLGPMFATAGGKRFKGSDYIWQAFRRAVARDPGLLEPGRLADEPDLFVRSCEADDGVCPVPAARSHAELQRAYGAALCGGPPGGIAAMVAAANDSDRPGASLLEALREVPGYAEDPLAKKANLLVVVLAGRPERFLDLRDPDSVQPIVDYHLMRGCLRTGCVEVTDPELRARLQDRRWVDTIEERSIRTACAEAIAALVDGSGRTVADVDAFFFATGREVCPETEAPRCGECGLRGACAEDTDAFQPVFRTTAY